MLDDTLYTGAGQPRKRQMDSDRRATWHVARKRQVEERAERRVNRCRMAVLAEMACKKEKGSKERKIRKEHVILGGA